MSGLSKIKENEVIEILGTKILYLYIDKPSIYISDNSSPLRGKFVNTGSISWQAGVTELQYDPTAVSKHGAFNINPKGDKSASHIRYHEIRNISDGKLL